MRSDRRAFLALLTVAPIAALAPWRPFRAHYHARLGPVDYGVGRDYTVVRLVVPGHCDRYVRAVIMDGTAHWEQSADRVTWRPV